MKIVFMPFLENQRIQSDKIRKTDFLAKQSADFSQIFES